MLVARCDVSMAYIFHLHHCVLHLYSADVLIVLQRVAVCCSVLQCVAAALYDTTTYDLASPIHHHPSRAGYPLGARQPPRTPITLTRMGWLQLVGSLKL